MKSTVRAICSICTTILLCIGCREWVEGELPQHKVTPVVNSILKNDSVIKVHLSLTVPLDETKYQVIDSAEILLYEDGEFQGLLSYDGEGIYTSRSMAVPNKFYSFEIDVPGYEGLKATEYVPAPVELYQVQHINFAGKNEEGIIYPAVKVAFQNDPTEVRYYEIVIQLLSHGRTWAANLEEITDPIILNEGVALALFSNKQIVGDTAHITVNYTTGSTSGSVTGLYPLFVELRAVSENYYRYKKQLHIYEKSRYPDGLLGSNAVATLYSNVLGGYGIVAGYSVTKSDTIVPN